MSNLKRNFKERRHRKTRESVSLRDDGACGTVTRAGRLLSRLVLKHGSGSDQRVRRNQRSYAGIWSVLHSQRGTTFPVFSWTTSSLSWDFPHSSFLIVKC